MATPRYISHVCVDCGSWYWRKQHPRDPYRCLDCAVEYDTDVIIAQAARRGSIVLTRKYRGRSIERPHPSDKGK